MNKGKVYIGLSGGVDSSVAAALLIKEGYDVTGVFIQGWYPDWIPCTWREDRLDAMRVAVRLGIPFVTLNLEDEYKRDVIDYLVAEYRKGRTPNPDIMCNREVKFGAFARWAYGQGAQYVATGHYARIVDGALCAGVDDSKDQSYFLWALSKDVLLRTLFPLGGMKKDDVRRLARRYGLPTATKGDSQGICFLGEVDIDTFLSHYIPPHRGDVLDEAGRVIGHHDGVLPLTLGARHGFTLTRRETNAEPYYVVARDIERNTITVAHRAYGGGLPSQKRDYELVSTNWIEEVMVGHTYTARIRHLGEKHALVVNTLSAGTARVAFNTPCTIAPGQSVVLYDGERCLGGGIVA